MPAQEFSSTVNERRNIEKLFQKLGLENIEQAVSEVFVFCGIVHMLLAFPALEFLLRNGV